MICMSHQSSLRSAMMMALRLYHDVPGATARHIMHHLLKAATFMQQRIYRFVFIKKNSLSLSTTSKID